jgi:dTDP-4-dehydrorhamnose reductase
VTGACSEAGAARAPGGRIELWAGAECTVNRVADRFFDQLVRTGHDVRLDDMDRIAALGVSACRFPVLWERVSDAAVTRLDFDWCDVRLDRLRILQVRPVFGLVHHGSGPYGTDLRAQSFVEGLARYAEQVARRYPWVTDFTPVNEPVTTARFSALYGHWYPHARDTAAFFRALVTEVLATRAAMAAIRRITPHARLVQTEDAGHTFSTPPLAYQASYENQRRRLGLDLLTGKVDQSHPLRRHLVAGGIDPSTLDELVAHPCPPDIIGLNYYVTSDRFLDHRIQRYPEHCRGGNERQRYADVEAVRVAGVEILGHRRVLLDWFRRYRIPVALTEVHLACTREQQLRWFLEAWHGAKEARLAGADVRAVTAWAIFGAFDWDSLVTHSRGSYESGVFDIRARAPRETAMTEMMRCLSKMDKYHHAATCAVGWWRSDSRVLYRKESSGTRTRGPCAGPPLVIVGTSLLAEGLRSACDHRGLPRATESLLERNHDSGAAPWAVILAPDLVTYGRRAITRALRTELERAARLAAYCSRRGIPMAVFSTEAVFDGRKECPYSEGDETRPVSVLGLALRTLERATLQSGKRAVVFRSGPLFDWPGDSDPVTQLMRRLYRGQPVWLPDDELVSPTFAPDCIDAALDLLIDGENGVLHLANPGATTLFELVRTLARRAGVSTERLARCARLRRGSAAEPRIRALLSARISMLRPLVIRLESYFEACRWRGDALTAGGSATMEANPVPPSEPFRETHPDA